MNHRINLTEENIVNTLLEGAGLSAFIFHTHFQLVLSCDTNKKFGEKKIPWEISACGNKDEDNCWSVICDEGKIYCNIPI